MRPPALYLEAFLFAFAVLLMEVSYTRVFSFKLVYYFAYLVIGIAMLGLGAGGVFVAVFPSLRRMPPEQLIPRCGVLAAFAVAAGYLLVAVIPLNLFAMIGALGTADFVFASGELVKLIVVCLAVFTPFFLAGLVLAIIFATDVDRISRLYGADLAGAALACALCIPLMTWLSPPGTIWAAGFAFAAASVRLAANSRPLLVTAAVLMVVLLGGAAAPTRLPDPVPDSFKVAPVGRIFSGWSPVFRVDVLPEIAGHNTMFIEHDALLGSAMRRFSGDFAPLGFETSDRQIPFRVLDRAPNVAIIGAAGGHEILASLYFGASHVTGVELNPVTVSLLRDHFADYTGRIAYDPRVTYINGEGRSFLQGSDKRYDLVWYVAPDSYAAMNAATSGAYVLVESYLYTKEMIITALERLTQDGVIAAQFGEFDMDGKPNRTTRYVATAREALRALGVKDPARHVVVSSAPGFGPQRLSTILVKREPFTDAEVERFARAVGAVPDSRIEFDGRTIGRDRPFGAALILPDAELPAWHAAQPFDRQAITDDAPFFWHFVRFRDALKPMMSHVEEGVGERVLLVFLGVAVLLAAVFLLAPLVMLRGVWREIPYKANTFVYFAALGLGFMLIEVSLIQRLTLFLGYPTHSLTVTLFALLVSSGIGSLLTDRLAGRWKQALPVYTAVLLLLVAFYEVALSTIVTYGIGWPFGLRVVTTAVLLVPLGLCLGAFMPLGLSAIANVTVHREEYVAWAWATNGFFSVVSSVLATILSMTMGLWWVMVCGAAVYVVAIVALWSLPARVPAETAEPRVAVAR
jgi:spermidine synthase